MDDPQKNDVSVAPPEKKECTMCKFVLIFAFVVLVVVAVFAYIVRHQTATPASSQPPIQMTKPLTGADIDRLMRDQGGLIVSPADPHVQPVINGVPNGGTGGIPKQ